MIDFRVSRLIAAIILTTVWLAATTTAAETTVRYAQLGPPVRLGPPPSVTQSAPPSAAQATTPDKSQIFDGPGVEVNPLAAVDPDSVGLLDQANGSFGVDMWKGTDRALVERLIPALPGAMRSKMMRDLMRRLLLSTATAPEGKASKRSLFAMRVEGLIAMGDVQAAIDLLRVAPTVLADEDLGRTEVEALFLRNDNAGACNRTRNLVRQYQSVYWQKALTFCLSLAGEHAKAALSADIMREQDEGADEAFLTLVEALAGNRNLTVDSLPNPSGLKLAMMQAASLKLPADVMVSNSPAIVGFISLAPNADLMVRLDPAERAETVGALSTEALSQLYESVSFTSDELENALSKAEADWGPRGRALLYRAARTQPVPAVQAEILRQAFQLGRDKGGYGLVVRTNLPVLVSIRASTELQWFASEAARALLATSRTAEAKEWIDLLEEPAQTSAAAAVSWAALWPLVHIVEGDAKRSWDQALSRRWWEGQKSKAKDDAVRRASTLYTLLAALDRPLGIVEWGPLLAGPQRVSTVVPTAALWHTLADSSKGGRIGETVMLALIALGEEGPAEASMLTLKAVIGALKRVGLDIEARSLSIEAAIAAGL